LISKTYEVSLWAVSDWDLATIYDGESIPTVRPLGYQPHGEGWIRVGTGSLTANLIDHKDTVAEQVKALEAQIQKAEADAQRTITILRGKINNLLAICHDGE
jgi:hypothetical protein